MVQLQIIGHVGADAVIKQVNGKNVINFSVADTEKFKNKDGIAVENTTWIECGQWAEKTGVAAYLKKGTLVCVVGKPMASAYTNKDGKPAASLKLNVSRIELLSSGSKSADNTSAGSATQQPQEKDALADIGEALNDDLPF